MTMSADWATISSLATAGGTLVLAVATFASVRSGNRAARAAERSLLIGIRPLLMPSHPQDVEQKIMFVDSHWVKAPGGGATAEAVDGAIYLTLSLRNAGSGMAVLHGWVFHPDRIRETRPDYVLILPWNLRDEIIEQMAYIRGWGGQFVVPIPEVKVYP